ncbi:MAG: hypothetical protein IT384_17720 [Deltaproteobacteria bacterium]|nr:hypothetical protein [Deltaproteobacteria bacterium]
MLRVIVAFFFGFDWLSPASVVLSPLDRFMPCTPGLAVRYRMLRDGVETGEVIERVEGRGTERATCVLARETKGAGGVQRQRFAREHLPDRISDAGPVELPLAFRPPILKAPIRAGQRWHFNGVDSRIATTTATFELAGVRLGDVVRIVSRPTEGGANDTTSEYAPGVGLVRVRRGGFELRAVQVIPEVLP